MKLAENRSERSHAHGRRHAVAGLLTDEHDASVVRTVAEDRLRRRAVQRTSSARRRLPAQGFEVVDLIGTHGGGLPGGVAANPPERLHRSVTNPAATSRPSATKTPVSAVIPPAGPPCHHRHAGQVRGGQGDKERPDGAHRRAGDRQPLQDRDLCGRGHHQQGPRRSGDHNGGSAIVPRVQRDLSPQNAGVEDARG